MVGDNPVHRRNVLRLASAAGASAIAGTASAQEEPEHPIDAVPTETVGDVAFAELGVEFDLDATPTNTACHGTPYLVDEERGVLFVTALSDEDRSLIESEDAVLKRDGLHALPARLNRTDLGHVPVTTAGNLAPEGSIPVDEPVRIPAIRVDRTDGAIDVSAGGASSTVSDGSSGGLALDPRPVHVRGAGDPAGEQDARGASNRGNGNSSALDATPEVLVNNYGELTVEVAVHEEVDA